MKRRIVDGLEWACTLSHPLLHRRPFLWCGRVCWLSLWSYSLDQRWHTGRWVENVTPRS